MVHGASPWLPLGSLSSSINAFLDAASTFFTNLADIKWSALILALGIHFLHICCRGRGWFNTLRAAYPGEQFRYRRILGAYIAGVGVNSVVPIRGGDVVKIYLAKHSIEGSRYPTVTASFFVESIFDLTIGSLVMLFAISQGVLPSLPTLPDLPAFDLAFWADHPRLGLFLVTAVTVGLLVTYAVLSVRAVVFWNRVKQGVVIVRDFRRYLRQVAAWQAAAWVCRFFAFYFFLEAFNIGGSVRNALLVMSVQALSTLTPFTPGGAGAQQALLVYVFRDIAPKTAVLAYSVGQQIAMAAFNAVLGLTALFLMVGHTDFRRIVRLGREEEEVEGAA
jgi:glycosyltransferase 2 family protein